MLNTPYGGGVSLLCNHTEGIETLASLFLVRYVSAKIDTHA